MSSRVISAKAATTSFIKLFVTSLPPRCELPLLLITVYVFLLILITETSREPPPKSNTSTISFEMVLIRP